MRLLRPMLLAVPLLAACGVDADLDAPDLPMGKAELNEFWQHTTWRPREDVRIDVDQPAPSRRALYPNSIVVGEVKVIEGDSTNVSSVSTDRGLGYGLRMDSQRQDLARITAQVLDEEGDHFDFVVVFPTFEDVMNPGFAYFSTIKSEDSGIGLPQMDQSRYYGSAGRLQGFLNMNHPSAYTNVDGLPITDAASAVYPIMGQELTHRWLAFALVKKDGFNNGEPSDVLLGRDQAHWSALMHTGPADMSGAIYSSVQDGIAWVDNGNGTFTAADVFSDQRFTISARSRFSTLDLYLMGLYAKEEVDPFFVIDQARYSGRTVPADARLPRGATVSGQRVDFTIDHVIAALGERVPSVLDAPKDFNTAIVVLTAPGQTAAEVMDLVNDVDTFRATWERKFSEWTDGRGTVCTAMGGNCATARVKLDDVRVEESVADGSIMPGEPLTVRARVMNQGTAVSAAASVAITVEDGTVEQATKDVAPLDPGASVDVTFDIAAAATMACNDTLRIGLTLEVPGVRPAAITVERALGLRVLERQDMETADGWVVNPDGNDTAVNGRWGHGSPFGTDFRSYGASEIKVQPTDDASDDGSHAFFTDPGTASLDPAEVGQTDVDDGTTTLLSPALAVGDLIDPVLSFSSWHLAVIVNTREGRLDDAEGDDLITELSTDMTTWIELDRDATNDFRWKTKRFRLKDVPGLTLDNSTHIRLRFTIGDRGPQQNLVEAGIDEVRITDVAPACIEPDPTTGGGGDVNPGAPSPGAPAADGCECAGGAGEAPQAGLVACFALIVLRRRRVR